MTGAINMKNPLLVLTLVLLPGVTSAKNLHISPEIKMGPYWGAGISGGGLQLGGTGVLGLDALYMSYSHTSAELLWDKDRLKTYRIGAQYQLLDHPNKLGFQIEAGLVEYEGQRDYIWSDKSRSAHGSGASISGAWVLFMNEHVGLRVGGDFNYIDKKKTLLGNSWSATFSTGIVIHL
ncbi:hypothetical protein ACPV5J_16510 [Vibrio rotiferianus]|uniref:hypothetical protein n=1 Tax=Vibrio rotiferianus TaxID=190895 RepID=UPI00406A6354